MAGFGWAGAAKSAQDGLQEMLVRAFIQRQQEEQLRMQQQRMEDDRVQFDARLGMDNARLNFDRERAGADEKFRLGQQARQTRQDDIATSERNNAQGERAMIGEFLTRRTPGQPLGDTERATLEAMAVTDGIQLPESLMAKPQRKVITTLGKSGEPISKAFTEDELAQGVPEYRAPERGPVQSPEWVKTAAGQVVKRVPQAGDMPYEKGSEPPQASESGTADTLALLERFEKHPGTPRAYGVVNSRTSGFSQDAQDALGIRDQLIAQLALPNLGVLKGPASDNDVRFIKQMTSRLSSQTISPAEVMAAIGETRAYLQRRQAEEAGMGRTGGGAPSGGGRQRWGRDAQGRPVRLGQ